MRKNIKVESPFLNLAVHTAVGAGVGLVCAIVFSLLFALVLNFTDLPHRSIAPVSMIIIALSFFIGAFVAGKMLHKKGLLLGMLIGIFSFALIFVVGLFVPDESIGVTDALKAVLCIVPAIIGAVLGVNTRIKY